MIIPRRISIALIPSAVIASSLSLSPDSSTGGGQEPLIDLEYCDGTWPGTTSKKFGIDKKLSVSHMEKIRMFAGKYREESVVCIDDESFFEEKNYSPNSSTLHGDSLKKIEFVAPTIDTLLAAFEEIPKFRSLDDYIFQTSPWVPRRHSSWSVPSTESVSDEILPEEINEDGVTRRIFFGAIVDSIKLMCVIVEDAAIAERFLSRLRLEISDQVEISRISLDPHDSRHLVLDQIEVYATLPSDGFSAVQKLVTLYFGLLNGFYTQYFFRESESSDSEEIDSDAPHGLMNIDKNCFLNAAVQIILAVSDVSANFGEIVESITNEDFREALARVNKVDSHGRGNMHLGKMRVCFGAECMWELGGYPRPTMELFFSKIPKLREIARIVPHIDMDPTFIGKLTPHTILPGKSAVTVQTVKELETAISEDLRVTQSPPPQFLFVYVWENCSPSSEWPPTLYPTLDEALFGAHEVTIDLNGEEIQYKLVATQQGDLELFHTWVHVSRNDKWWNVNDHDVEILAHDKVIDDHTGLLVYKMTETHARRADGLSASAN